MARSPASSGRRPRADGLRNRERLIEAATRVFGAGAPQASLEAVAREAGVGIGTLYRHFPTREALFEAVYRREVDQLSDLAERLARAPAPVEALRQWLHANVRLVATKRGMVEALHLVVSGSAELKAYSFERLTAALALLLARGVEAGDLRGDITAEDLLRTVVGIFYADSSADWQASALRIVDVFVDGLRRP
ncbi:TetR/AcrR family transcriptional regulator [Caulobacter sp. KR2-114]|uniref:TetR/AcrR family transcriptional regulator n=1 Tax=Caulobacter sp. KR2-114 TaxID=3400912 RepID=UPI003C0E3573